MKTTEELRAENLLRLLEILDERKPKRRVRERLLRLNPDGLPEGCRLRGWHRKATVANTTRLCYVFSRGQIRRRYPGFLRLLDKAPCSKGRRIYYRGEDVFRLNHLTGGN